MFNRRVFFGCVRSAVFGGVLRQHQVTGMEKLLAGFEKRLLYGDHRWLAYMLATAFHETAGTMMPVRETLAKSDDAAIAILDKAFAEGRLPTVRAPYWQRDAEGKSWLGRGLVQLTHRRNYIAMSTLTGYDLVARPQRAMEMDVSVTILIEGMRTGRFTGRRLSDFFEGGKADWDGAREIINGRDRAARVAAYGRSFHVALVKASRQATFS
jgi:hypothetical protein